jgi:hypothetical protein
MTMQTAIEIVEESGRLMFVFGLFFLVSPGSAFSQ